MHFPSPEQFPPFTMQDYFKSKFDYQWDMSGGRRFIVVPGNMSLNQQKLIPREQTPKQLPGNPRRAPALAHKIYKTVFHLMEAGKVAAVSHGPHRHCDQSAASSHPSASTEETHSGNGSGARSRMSSETSTLRPASPSAQLYV